MGTGYYLLDHPNPRAAGPDGPYRFHGYLGRNGTVRVGVIHVAVTAPTTQSAEAIARYFATTDRAASYHVIVDSDGALRLIPTTGTAFGARGYNSPAVHLSFACRTDTWHRYPAWSRAAYGHAAPVVAAWSDRYDLPFRYVSKAEVDRGVRGWTFHATLDPSRRTDPGAPPHGSFDLEHLFRLAGEVLAGPSDVLGEEDDMLRFVQDDDNRVYVVHGTSRSYINHPDTVRWLTEHGHADGEIQRIPTAVLRDAYPIEVTDPEKDIA